MDYQIFATEIEAANNQAEIDAARFLCSDKSGKLLDDSYLRFADRMLAANILQHLAKQSESCGLPAETSKLFARMAFTVLANRSKAIEKFGSEIGEKLLFDSDGLQMATGLECGRYHASLIRQSGLETVIDLTAGIGGDTIAFAMAGLSVVAYESDPVRSLLLGANLARLGLGSRVTVKTEDWIPANLFSSSALFLDPPRRSDESTWGGAAIALQMVEKVDQTPNRLVLAKLSPAVDDTFLSNFAGGVQFISERRVCKEALLVIDKESRVSGTSVVVLPGPHILTIKPNQSSPKFRALEIDTYLYEPDPGVVRAKALNTLAETFSLTIFDIDSDYLIGNDPIGSPFLTAYKISTILSYRKDTIQKFLNEKGCTSLVVKTRHVSLEPEQVRRQFKLKAKTAGNSREIILALVPQDRSVVALELEPISHIGEV